MIEIYTDGSCIKDNKGGFGIVITENNQILDTYSERYNDTTNNQMEMKAILWAIHYIIDNNITDKVIIYSDSQYAISSFIDWAPGWERNGWVRSRGEPVLNLELVQEGYKLLGDYGNIILKKVKGHNGVEFNEIADMLATNTPCKKLCYGKDIPQCKYFDNISYSCILKFNDLFDRYMLEEGRKIKNKEK